MLAGFIAVVFAVGLTELFLLRFESGVDYPEYSSLRSDPRGTMALYESLSGMPGLEVSRNLKPAETLKDSQATIFFLGVKSGGSVEAAGKLASGGARVVIGHLHPENPSGKAERLFTEEKRGKGTIVELRDSYWLSNEALLKKRDPDLISEEESFLLQLERTNVAISRARAKCILVISEDLAYHLPSDRETILTSKAVKTYVSDFCRELLPFQVGVGGNAQRQLTLRWHNSGH